ncbi:MAG TPA: type II toxin-antitoxin system VapC family toxin [Thermoanaerobaculia bacterium]|nr:type II toxin-antitoxin system VapC family toxin [Thermoanaerobaculia bacterium]
MILPDLNLLIYAYNDDAPEHAPAKTWWESCLSETRPVGLPWAVMLGYVRLITGRVAMVDPFSARDAIGHVRSWLERPQVEILTPGPRHLDLVDSLMRDAQASGNLAMDAHLAALAIEHGAEIHSNDADFSRFPGLRWINPLA